MTQYFKKSSDGEYEEVKGFSKEDIDGIIGDAKWFTERLERERSKYADYSELKTKAEKLDSLSTDYEAKISDLTEAQKDFDAKLAAANLKADRLEVVHKFNLPEDLAEFVVGDTKEDMFARAEKLSKNLPTGVNLEKKEKDEPNASPYARMARELLGSSDD